VQKADKLTHNKFQVKRRHSVKVVNFLNSLHTLV
jgi:hypothetical protein